MTDKNKTSIYAVDLSDCGTFRIVGKRAGEFVRTMFTGEMTPCDTLFGLSQGMLLTSQGEVIDMVMVVRTGDDEFLLLTSPGNHEEDFEWLTAHVELKDAEDNEIFPETSVEDQSKNLAVLLMYGPQTLKLYDALIQACDGKFLFIPVDFDEPAYMVPMAPAKMLFVPINIAPQIGDFLNEWLEVEVLEPGEYMAQISLANQYCGQLNMAEYHTPKELGLEKYLRKERDFVGFRALEDEEA